MWLEITTLLIPGENDGDAELGALASWVAGNWARRAAAFQCVPSGLADAGPAAHPAGDADQGAGIAMGRGLRYVYTGNVHDPAGGSTWCPGCGALLIERDWYQLGAWGLTGDGRCANCDTPLAGVFDTSRPRRRPILVCERGGRCVTRVAGPRISRQVKPCAKS